MAGLGRKVFNSGDILLASEVQGYLQDQAVMVFDDSATRATAIGTANFSEGMASYLKDTDQVEVYNGSNWASVSPTDSGLIHIETQTYSAVTSVDFENVFSADFTNYRIVMQGQGGFGGGLSVRLLSGSTPATGSNYDSQNLSINSTTVTATQATSATSGNIGGTNNTPNNLFIMEIAKPFGANETMFSGQSSVTASNINIRIRAVVHTLANSYDGVQIISNGTNDLTGTARLYGYKD